uniref:Peptidase S1 domain-containing protein n=1 Tax=Gasterosteus aculeatus aculeatus TaxID=481459 RepID=A0AAQ4PWT5_GASAC
LIDVKRNRINRFGQALYINIPTTAAFLFRRQTLPSGVSALTEAFVTSQNGLLDCGQTPDLCRPRGTRIKGSGRTPGAWVVYLGRETQAGPNPNEVRSTVSQVLVHPDYNNTLFNNDIALLKLQSPVQFNDFIRPVCLASNVSQFHTSTPCWATGWGNLRSNLSLPASQPLQEVPVPVVGENQCACGYRLEADANITNEMICAGEENRGTCQGDSGGPLQCKQASNWIQAGITSFGVPCARAGFPEVYARVSQFQTWITEQVAGATVSFVTFRSNGTDADNSFVCRSPNTASSVAPELTFVIIIAAMLLQNTMTQ